MTELKRVSLLIFSLFLPAYAILAVGCQSPPTPIPTPTITPSSTRAPVAARDAFGPDPYEPDNSIVQATLMTLDGSAQPHNLHVEGDRDYVSFDAEEGIVYMIETRNLGGGIDPISYLYDSEENELARNDDGAEEPLASRIVWVAPSDGMYYLMIRDLGDNSAGPDATYDIRVTAEGPIKGDPYEPNDTIRQAKAIETDATHQTHTFHTSTDADYVCFRAQQGVQYTIATGNLQGGCDTTTFLYSKDGTELDYDDDAGEVYASLIVWTAPSSDTYYVMIEEFTGRAGPDVSYEIWVSQLENSNTL